MSNEQYDSRPETLKHKVEVSMLLSILRDELTKRSLNHDNSKLEDPELAIFNEYTPKLKNTTYGSDEYKQFLKEMKVALDHHYAENRHHPEHFENGVKDMNLVDIVEMFCDWFSAVKRHADGDVLKSIEINQKRFGYGDQLKAILINTVPVLEEKDET